MKDYGNSKIYMVVSPNNKLVYYGSTIDKLKNRFSKHKSKSKKFCTSKKIIESGDADIIEVESYPCKNLHELEDREAEYIVNNWNGCVNQTVPGAIRRAGGMKGYNQLEQRKAKKKEYSKRPEVIAHRAEKIPCNLCGCMVTRSYIAEHQRTQKCQKILQEDINIWLDDIINQIEKV